MALKGGPAFPPTCSAYRSCAKLWQCLQTQDVLLNLQKEAGGGRHSEVGMANASQNLLGVVPTARVAHNPSFHLLLEKRPRLCRILTVARPGWKSLVGRSPHASALMLHTLCGLKAALSRHVRDLSV